MGSPDENSKSRDTVIDGGGATDSEIGEGGPIEDVGTADGKEEVGLVQRETVVQTGSSIPILTAPTKAGNLVVVIVAVEGNGKTVTSITDNAPGGSNTYVSTQYRSIDPDCEDSLEIWYAANLRPGATVVNVTLNLSEDVEAWMAEFKGLSKTSPLDTGLVRDRQPRGTSVIAPLVTPGAPSALVISAAMVCDKITGLKAGSAFQPFPILNGETAAYLFTSAPGSYGAEWNSTSGTWNATTVSFK